MHLGGHLDRVGLGRDVIVGCAARLHGDQVDLASIQLVVRREVVDVLLCGLALLGEALVAAGVLEERLLEHVGLRLIERDGDRVLGDPRRGRTAVVPTLPRLHAGRRVTAGYSDLARLGVAVGTPVDLFALRLRLIERERTGSR